MATVRFDDASHLYPGADDFAVDGLNLDIADGEFLVLVGPSGCGKSTSLRMLAGLESVDRGVIEIDGRDVTGLPPKARDVAMVFQSYALYPNMTVAQNMGFALRNAGMSRADTLIRVREAAGLLELTDLLDRKPAKLSGGQRQRVAMGRAIVRRPQVFCMDEPLSNLDARLRVSTRTQIAALQKRLGITTVYVTHDQVEAMTMGDRVAVLRDGKLQQIAKPRELYDNPTNIFVAAFIGSPSMNLLEAPVADGAAMIGPLRVPIPRGDLSENRVIVGVRPESWDVAGGSAHSAKTMHGDTLAVEVELVEELGAESFVYATGTGTDWTIRGGKIVARVDRQYHVSRGDRLWLQPKPEDIYFFSPTTEQRLTPTTP